MERSGREAERQKRRLESSTERLNRRLERTADISRRVGRTMTRNVTLPLTAAGTAAITFAAQFEDSAGQVRATADLTADEIDQVREAVLAIGADTGESFDDLFSSLQKAVSGSLDLAESQELVAVAAKASAAGFGDMERLVDVSTTAFDLFQGEAESAEEILDQIVNTAQNTQVNVEEMSGAFSRGASAAAAMGLSQNDLLSVLGVVAERFGDTRRAGTSVQQMLLNLLDPSGQAEQNFEDLFGSMDAFRELMQEDVVAAMQELDQRLEENNMGMEDVFTSSQSVNAALNLMSDSGERAADVLRQQDDAAGSVSNAFDDSESTLRELSRAWNELQKALIPVGDILIEEITPAFESMVDSIRDTADWFQNLEPETQRLIIGMGGVAAAAGPAALGVAGISSALRVLSATGGSAVGMLTRLHPAVVALGGAAAIAAGSYGAMRDDGNRWKESLAEQREELEMLQDDIESLGEGLAASRYGQLMSEEERLRRERERRRGDLEVTEHLLTEGGSRELFGSGTTGRSLDEVVGDPDEMEAEIRAISEELGVIHRQQELIREAGEEDLSVRLGIVNALIDQITHQREISEEDERKLVALNEERDEIRELIQERREMARATSDQSDSEEEINRQLVERVGIFDDLNDRMEGIRGNMDVFLSPVTDTIFPEQFRAEHQELAEELERINQLNNVLGSSFDDTAARASAYRSAIEMLVEEGFDPNSEAMVALTRRYQEFRSEMDEGTDEIKQQSEAARQLEFTLNSAFEEAIFRGNSFRDVLQGILEDIQRIGFRRGVTEPLFDAIGGLSIDTESASGDVFAAGNIQRFASGGLVDEPTVFAHGGGTGLMAEAGTEAIMPVQRDSKGDLGVSVSQSPVNVNIVNNSGGEVEIERTQNPGGGEDITAVISRAVASDLERGGPVSRSLRKNLQVSRRGTR